MRSAVLSSAEVANRLGLDVRTVHAARRADQIPGWVLIGARWYLPRQRLADLLSEPAPVAPRPAVRFRA